MCVCSPEPGPWTRSPEPSTLDLQPSTRVSLDWAGRARSHSISLALSLTLFLSLSLSHTHTHTYSLSRLRSLNTLASDAGMYPRARGDQKADTIPDAGKVGQDRDGLRAEPFPVHASGGCKTQHHAG